MKRFALIVGLLAALGSFALPALPSWAQGAAPYEKLQRADGARIVPEQFLRSWDPVTIFFDRDRGPAAGGPEDAPERFVTMEPGIAGAWQWLGPRALQFRPAEAWKPLQGVTFKGEGLAARLVPLLPIPVSASPSDQEHGISELDRITLTFPEPVDLDVLKRLMSIELRPLPGIIPDGGTFLTPQDFSIAALERAARSEQQTYTINLKSAVPEGRVAILRLKLADEPGLDEPIYELRLRTAVPFTAKEAKCSGVEEQVLDGVLQCQSRSADSEDDEGSGAKIVRRGIVIKFSARPEPLDVIRARDALRISPAVDNLTVKADGTRLQVSASFMADQVYELRLDPGSIVDTRHRALEGDTFVQRFAFAPASRILRWDAGAGVVERFGPQLVPVRGSGYEKADIRIHAIDPLARDFWPFPSAVDTDDGEEPPLPGNEPAKWADADEVNASAIAARIKALGSPAVSELMPLPIRRGGSAARFGLDLKPLFARIAGRDQPGAYLVGLRAVDGGKRQWLRVQVTDLTLSTVEEPDRVRFVVTSLSTATPVAGAEVRLEGVRAGQYLTLARGMTDVDGAFMLPATTQSADIRRIVVSKGLDTLVLNPAHGPLEYAKENWTKPRTTWLGWPFGAAAQRLEERRTLCHLFSERPIYRPEEPVHIKGYVRSYHGGKLTIGQTAGTIVITSPSKQEWRIPVAADAAGSFYYKFDAETPATGDYWVAFEPNQPQNVGKPAVQRQEQDEDSNNENENDEAAADTTGSCGRFTFKKEAYRLPDFEVLLNAPQQVPLDGEFAVDMIARYFAGGLVAERPIRWRASQFPLAWTPPGRAGFLFSSDARFSSDGIFKSTPVLERQGKTDASGSARITFDPTVEPTAQPRRYMIEATVTGENDIQVRNLINVSALPPFALGVKIARYQPRPGTIEPEIIAVKPSGEPVADLPMTVRFIKRNWTSVLQASDFSQGSAKYVTQVIDETLIERKVTSAKEAQRLSFEARDAGVYLVQLEAADKLGRRQQVTVDFFVGGDTPTTWARPPAQTATVTTDKDSYAPGESATLLIQSPFQTARALAIVEEPGGSFRYDWVDIANGYGRYVVPVRKEEVPKLAVHFLIMRGRLQNAALDPTAPFDQGKPVTVAATKWVTVTPVKNMVTVALDYPHKARPGDEIEVTLRLSDDLGKPLAGEATFWMVDQAVLSLAKERSLDPLPDFIVERATKMAARDTRGMAFGIIPLEEIAGGDVATDQWGSDNNVSVRKNFTPVPIYLPKVTVGPDGVARVKVKLPDSLTVFKLRAKVVSGPDRFGFGTGEMMVRQDLVAQPVLPRFVRPGDEFDASLIGRVVEGPAGTGRAALEVVGLKLPGAPEQRFSWTANKPARLDFPAVVAASARGSDAVRLRFSLQRDADRAADNVQIDLPVRPDRPPLRQREIVELPAGGSITVHAHTDAMRPGTYARSLTLATDPVVVRMMTALNYLLEYPYGCTEQRIALASSGLALKSFAPVLASVELSQRVSADVAATARAIEQSVDSNGLVAFWPRATGNVSLTAWAYEFLVAADKAGEPIDKKLKERLAMVLKRALRSDYPRLLSGEEIRERVEALTALSEGEEGHSDSDIAYVTELSRRAEFMPNASIAQITANVARLPGDNRRVLETLLDRLWGRVKILSRDGKPYYAGQAGDHGNPLILPSETRNLAEITRAVAEAAPGDERLAVLRDGLIRISDASGWGTTNANAAAVRALAAVWQKPATELGITITGGSESKTFVLSADAPVAVQVSREPTEMRIANGGTAAGVALVDTRYQPTEPGSRAGAVERGFVLTRQAYRVPASGPIERVAPDADGAIHLAVGDVVEESAELVNPEDRTHIAISLPLAAGLEPLNPNLATAPAEATPSAAPTLSPTYVSFADDRVFYAYDNLPKGNYRFVFRTRALIPGSFTQPPGEVETMYRPGVYGTSAGQRVVITR